MPLCLRAIIASFRAGLCSMPITPFRDADSCRRATCYACRHTASASPPPRRHSPLPPSASPASHTSDHLHPPSLLLSAQQDITCHYFRASFDDMLHTRCCHFFMPPWCFRCWCFSRHLHCRCLLHTYIDAAVCFERIANIADAASPCRAMLPLRYAIFMFVTIRQPHYARVYLAFYDYGARCHFRWCATPSLLRCHYISDWFDYAIRCRHALGYWYAGDVIDIAAALLMMSFAEPLAECQPPPYRRGARYFRWWCGIFLDTRHCATVLIFISSAYAADIAKDNMLSCYDIFAAQLIRVIAAFRFRHHSRHIIFESRPDAENIMERQKIPWAYYAACGHFTLLLRYYITLLCHYFTRYWCRHWH